MDEDRKISRTIGCIPITESERMRLMGKMSQECRKISEEAKWSKHRFNPSFEVTDKILIEAARRIYSALGSSDR